MSRKPGSASDFVAIDENIEARIIKGLQHYYNNVIKPVEAAYKFDHFHSPFLDNSIFAAAPMVMLIGQYSVGKTTFIQYLVERDLPNAHIGPEPTTDSFCAYFYDNQNVNGTTIPGNALAADKDKPFTATQRFGMSFLNRFQGVGLNAPFLKKITLIDSPGILSGEKQRIGRQYVFSDVVSWFAERCDRILLLFDAHKLDISDEFREAIIALGPHSDKIKCVLNKADTIDSQALLRVYGSLLWSLGRVVKTPEVLRVYIGSFWDQPYKITDNEALLKAEEADLLADLRSLPRNSLVRKINELLKRARSAKVHALICGHLRSQFGLFSKSSKQEKLINNMADHFKQVHSLYTIPTGDFPNIDRFKELIKDLEIWNFPKLDQRLITELDKALTEHIPAFMALIPDAQAQSQGKKRPVPKPDSNDDSDIDKDNSPPSYEEASVNPFEDDADSASPAAAWAIPNHSVSEFTSTFYSLRLSSGKLSGASARDIFMKMGLVKSDLRQIWTLSDIDGDGYLDVDEFIVASYLIDLKKRHDVMYDTLPPELLPPSKR